MLQDKKGLSIMIGYVLLVVIAIVMSMIVFQFVRTYVPKDTIACPDGVSVFMQEATYNCDTNILNITIKNNGRFSIAGYFIHATTSADQELATLDLSGTVENEDLTYLNSIVFIDGQNFLTSSDAKKTVFDVTDIVNLPDVEKIYKIEIIPVRFQEEEGKTRFASCGNAKVGEVLSCLGECTDTCANLGYECGTWNICGVSTICPDTCDLATEECVSGTCELTTIEFLKSLGAISWWKFEGDGTDEMGVNDGAISGADCTVTGRYGQACYFQGSSDMMLLSPVIDLSNTWTIATWFNYPLEEISHWKTLMRGNAGDHQVIVQTGTYDLGTYDNTGSTLFRDSGFNVDTLSNGWHHLVVVQDGTDMIFYIDNSQVGIISGYISTTDIYVIGNYQGGGQEWGTLDEFIIFNRDLSLSEIEQLYNLDLS